MNNEKACRLLTRPDGSPFVFCMRKNELFRDLNALIKDHGGFLVSDDDKSFPEDNTMYLLCRTLDGSDDIFPGRETFEFHFVTNSCEAKALKDPFVYRVPKETKFGVQNGNQVLQVLRGQKKWSDFIPRRKRHRFFENTEMSGESCSEIEEIEAEPVSKKVTNMSRSLRTRSKAAAQKSPQTSKAQKEATTSSGQMTSNTPNKSSPLKEKKNSPSSSKPSNEELNHTPQKSVKPGHRKLFNHCLSDQEQINETLSESEERTQRAQAVASRTTQYSLSSSDETVSDESRNETLKPFHKVFNILKEYELFNEVSLDSTWRFVSYILQDEEISQDTFSESLKSKFLSEIIPAILSDYSHGLKLSNNEVKKSRPRRSASLPRSSILNASLDNRIVEILVKHELFELDSEVVWKFVNKSLTLRGCTYQEIQSYFFENIFPQIDNFERNFKETPKQFLLWKVQSNLGRVKNVSEETLKHLLKELCKESSSESDEENKKNENITSEQEKPKKAKKSPEKDKVTKGSGSRDDKKSDSREFRKPYSKADDLKIIEYILDNSRQSEVGGISLWRDMESDEVLPQRSYQSLKERFRKRIVPNISSFKEHFSKEDLKELC